MRVYRYELINVLLDILAEAGIQPCYGKKFDRVLSENDEGVSWKFEDGSTGHARMLVGADGIHSRVRQYFGAHLQPRFTNIIAVTAAVPTKQLEADEYSLPVTIMNKQHGAFVIAPQLRDGSEVLVAKQCNFDGEPGRQEWDRLIKDKAWCVDFLRKGCEDFPPVVSRAVSQLSLDKINLWPFYLLPEIESWTSAGAGVVILGDAAHAIPPSAGQGINQAFEDVYTFAKVLSELQKNRSGKTKMVLKEWQRRRQARIDPVLELNAQMNRRRLPSKPGEDVRPEPFDLRWLYGVDFEAMIDEIFAGL